MTAHFFGRSSWHGEVDWLRGWCATVSDSVDRLTLVIDYAGPWRSFPWLDVCAQGWLLDVNGLRRSAPDLFDRGCLRRAGRINAAVKPVACGLVITAMVGDGERKSAVPAAG